MQIGKKHRFILFTLGILYDELNKKLKRRYLQISINKVQFIQLVKVVNITEKKARALYKNLETLEKKKLIVYKNRNLALTDKGKKLYLKIYKDNEPYINLFGIISKDNILKFAKKSQTVFKI